MGVFGGRGRTAADASPDGADERVASRRHRPAARRLSALASAVVLLAVGGWLWGAADPAPAGGGAAGPVRRPTEDELDVLQRAEQLLIRDCMKEQGFSYFPVPRRPSADYREFPYVVDDVDWARTNGYGRAVERRLDEEDAVAPRTAYYRSLPPDRAQALGVALNGPSPTGLEVANPVGGRLTHSDQGCAVGAWQRLYGDARAWFGSSEVVNNLFGIRAGRVTQDPAYRDAVAVWSACVAGRGHPADDPRQLRDRQLSREGEAAEREDVPVAVSEAECARSTGLDTTVSGLDRRYADAVRAEHRAVFDTMWRLQTGALPTAREVAARG
ncbi:hypothetical protein [Streptomyces sp. BE303]|uniref:hypothetical protein n=1 Tax=Streptomyces sp. BE303 TaxID=3002528 RepID=UPI002E7978D5|nr:hypothetical protein [Streptomyces sp. BE303]MED7947722.1 hypothetical protein [Streptomyces sp. BE303]